MHYQTANLGTTNNLLSAAIVQQAVAIPMMNTPFKIELFVYSKGTLPTYTINWFTNQRIIDELYFR